MKLDLGRKKCGRLGIQIDRDFSAGPNMATEFAVAAGDIEHRVIERNIALEKSLTQRSPNLILFCSIRIGETNSIKLVQITHRHAFSRGCARREAGNSRKI